MRSDSSKIRLVLAADRVDGLEDRNLHCRHKTGRGERGLRADCVDSDLVPPHYDVVAAGDERKWDSPPFEATERDGAIYGRGAADSKSNILVHVGALRAWEGKPPVGIKILIEGQEEVGSVLETPSTLEPFRADALLIADGGNIRAGVPSLTVGLRGDAPVFVEVRTLGSAKHCGEFGGAAPVALIALLHALASLHD